MKKAEKSLNADYTLLQTAYWAMNSVIFCFSVIFLQYKGYSNYEIGIVFALGNIVGFVLQPAVAGYVDKSRKVALIRCIRVTAALSAALMLAVLAMPERCMMLTCAYVLLVAGTTLLTPLCTSLCFYAESWGYSISFSRARAVGSLAYSACAIVLGRLVYQMNENAIPLLYIACSAMLCVMSMVFSVKERPHRAGLLPAENDAASEKASSLIEFAKENKLFMVFLAGTAVMFFTHALIGNFMIEFIRSIGGDSADLGNVLAFMTMVEVPVMLLFSRLTRHFRCSALLRFSVIMFTVKELMIYLAPSIAALYAAESLQAFSFALFIPASVRYVDEVIAKRNAVKGQALVTAMLTLGSIFASYIGGLLLDTSTPEFTLLVGVIISAVGTLMLLMSIQTTGAPKKDIGTR